MMMINLPKRDSLSLWNSHPTETPIHSPAASAPTPKAEPHKDYQAQDDQSYNAQYFHRNLLFRII